MKKLIFLVLAALTIVSCQKKETETTPQLQEVSFTAIEITPNGGLKSTAEFECVDNTPTNAHFVIGTTTYDPALFELDGVLYTQAIKLPVGTDYCLTEFFLYDDVDGSGSYNTGDKIVFATPADGSHYGAYVTDGIEYCFDVTAFTKAQLLIDVLCFEEAFYTDFGFDWFAVTEIVIREQCFFGDVCFKHFADYAESNYALQAGGLKIDMPAIMKLVVKKGGVEVPHSPFTNNTEEAGYGVGAPLCIEYPDNLTIDDEEFTIDLYIYLAVGNTFDYVWFHQWTFKDAEMIPAGQDGVVDFVLGNCNLTEPDLQLAPYMNLPATCYFQYNGQIPYQNTYFGTNLTGIDPGYDIYNGVWGVNCFNRLVTITGVKYHMNVYSSLYYPAGAQGADLPWDKANWLLNHLNQYPTATWYDFQQVLWKLENGAWGMGAYNSVPAANAIATTMYNDAMANGTGFVPLPGGWAAISFINIDPPQVQVVFVRVDP